MKKKQYSKKNAKSLYEAMLHINNKKEASQFLKDLCTPAEIRAIEERWLIVQLLHNTDLSYRQLNELTGVSTTTIGRVARFLKDENNKGYRVILDRINDETT